MEMMNDFVNNDWDGSVDGLLTKGPKSVNEKMAEIMREHEQLITRLSLEISEAQPQPTECGSSLDKALPHRSKFKRRI